MKKILYVGKSYILTFVGFLVFFLFMLFYFSKASIFWKIYNIIFIMAILVVIIIFLTSKLYLHNNYILERFVFLKKISFDEISCVMYKKKILGQDYVFYFKDGTKYKIRMDLAKKDDIYFQKYLSQHEIKLIEK